MKGTHALICIPDITGFTEFMSEVDLASSSKVIPTLLNKIIYSNDLGFKASEIEGDAVFFFKTGTVPTIEEVLDQCIRFYKQFYIELEGFSSGTNQFQDVENVTEILGLKMVIHYGVLDVVEVGSHLKLMGEDIIAAHRLLKNQITDKEYVLFTSSFLDQYGEHHADKLWVKDCFIAGTDYYEHIGHLSYFHKSLNELIKLRTH